MAKAFTEESAPTRSDRLVNIAWRTSFETVVADGFSAWVGRSEGGEATRAESTELRGSARHSVKSFPSMFSSSDISNSYRDTISSGNSSMCSRQSEELSASLYKVARTKRRSG